MGISKYLWGASRNRRSEKGGGTFLSCKKVTCDALRNLIIFAQFKKQQKNTHMLQLVKLRTKSNTPP